MTPRRFAGILATLSDSVPLSRCLWEWGDGRSAHWPVRSCSAESPMCDDLTPPRNSCAPPSRLSVALCLALSRSLALSPSSLARAASPNTKANVDAFIVGS